MKKYLTLIYIIYSTGICFGQIKYLKFHVTHRGRIDIIVVDSLIEGDAGHPKPVIIWTGKGLEYPMNHLVFYRDDGIDGKGSFVYTPDPNKKEPYEFNPADLMNKSISYFLKSQDTLKPMVFLDSSKYFYRRFLKLKSQGVPDSLNKFKSKLYYK